MDNKYWDRYEKGSEYIRRKNLIYRTDKNWKMYSGDQWDEAETGGEKLPFLNIIKPIIKHKVSTVSQNNMVAKFSDRLGGVDNIEVYQKLNDIFAANWETANMDQELWNVMRDSAVTGEGILFFGTGNVKDMEKVLNTDIMYGNEARKDVQEQPYIIIRQRLKVKDVKEIARKNGIPESDIGCIKADNDTTNLVGNKQELDSRNGKVTIIIHMERDEEGFVVVTKCVQDLIIEPPHRIASKDFFGREVAAMKQYPIVKMNWEDYPNSARGISDVEQLIPNQLEINKTLARRAVIIKMTAFPRLAYDENAIANPEALDEVGGKIAMQGGGMQSINQMIQYLSPAQTNGEPEAYTKDLINYSQELNGAGETATGNINPNRVAASAIMAIKEQAELPLNEQVAKMKTFVEDLAKLWVELWTVYKPQGITVNKPVIDINGNEVMSNVVLSADEIRGIMPEVRIDTSSNAPWAVEAELEFLLNFLEKQYITPEEMVKAAPNNSTVPKAALLDIFKEQKLRQQMMQMQQVQQPPSVEEQALAAWSN